MIILFLRYTNEAIHNKDYSVVKTFEAGRKARFLCVLTPGSPTLVDTNINTFLGNYIRVVLRALGSVAL